MTKCDTSGSIQRWQLEKTGAELDSQFDGDFSLQVQAGHRQGLCNRGCQVAVRESAMHIAYLLGIIAPCSAEEAMGSRSLSEPAGS